MLSGWEIGNHICGSVNIWEESWKKTVQGLKVVSGAIVPGIPGFHGEMSRGQAQVPGGHIPPDPKSSPLVVGAEHGPLSERSKAESPPDWG